MKVGLLFGSFNPIHIGHLVIANFMAEFTDLAQVWLIVSPHNPLKEKKSLLSAEKRFTQAKKAIGSNKKIKVSDIEFKLPQPSYTVNTLKLLQKKYPRNKFVLIIGSDNLGSFHKWKEYKWILNNYSIYVYPRVSFLNKRVNRLVKNHPNIKHVNAPRIDISSTFIREQMRKGKDLRYFVR